MCHFVLENRKIKRFDNEINNRIFHYIRTSICTSKVFSKKLTEKEICTQKEQWKFGFPNWSEDEIKLNRNLCHL